MKKVGFDDFLKLDVRIGEVIKVEDFEGLNKQAYKVWVDLGEELGIKKTSAQICDLYNKDELVGKQILAVVNFHEKQIKNFMSEILILGIYNEKGVILITPDKSAKKGDKLG